jgi:DNA-binding Lrp family transcriptional regulator
LSTLDETNKEILRLLGEDSRYRYTQIQRELKKKGFSLSREAVEYRVKKMIENKTIRKFAMITEPGKIGYQICVYVELDLLDPGEIEGVGNWLASLPNTAYVHSSTNFFDISARIFFTDASHMLAFFEELHGDPRIEDFRFDLIRKTFKVGPIAPI